MLPDEPGAPTQGATLRSLSDSSVCCSKDAMNSVPLVRTPWPVKTMSGRQASSLSGIIAAGLDDPNVTDVSVLAARDSATLKNRQALDDFGRRLGERCHVGDRNGIAPSQRAAS